MKETWGEMRRKGVCSVEDVYQMRVKAFIAHSKFSSKQNDISPQEIETRRAHEVLKILLTACLLDLKGMTRPLL